MISKKTKKILSVTMSMSMAGVIVANSHLSMPAFAFEHNNSGEFTKNTVSTAGITTGPSVGVQTTGPSVGVTTGPAVGGDIVGSVVYHDNVKYELKNDEYIVTGYSGNPVDVKILDNINGKKLHI